MKKKKSPKATLKSSSKAKPESKGKRPAMATASALIDARIEELNDWRSELLARLRALILAAEADVVEEWKWNVPVWSYDGIICTGEAYKSVVKLTFAHGAALKDPSGLFNSSLEGNTRRAIDFRDGDAIDEKAFKMLIRSAAAFNTAKPARATSKPLTNERAKRQSTKLNQSKSRGQATKRLVGAAKRPTTIAEYIRAAPRAGQPHLQRLYEILKSVAPRAEETIKWNAPFFIEPRFLFSFSACKAHLNFAPMQAALAPFREELKQHRTTKNFLQVPYDEPLPVDLIRRIAETSLRIVSERSDEAFW